MLKKTFLKTIPFLFFIVLLNSCDKEYTLVGSDLIGDSSFDLVKYESDVVAYNQKIGPVQSDNLPLNALGSYDNSSFGTTNANFATEVVLDATGPTIDATAKIKSVVLTVPYFYDNTKTVTNTDGSHVYVLDSIYGPDKAKMKLSVYESGYYMRDLDPEEQFLKPQKYFTNQNTDFDQIKIGNRLNDSLVADKSQNDEFFFDPSEYSVTTKDSKTGVETTTRTPPAMRLYLNKVYFQNKILKAPAASLSTNDLFKEYFRGLYFKIENIGSNPGNLNMINFREGLITITYVETIDKVDVEKTMVLNMKGSNTVSVQSVSLLTQSNANANYAYATNPVNINKVNGDDNLYLKGGEGSMAILDLFGPDLHGSDGETGTPNGVADELDVMRTKKYLINEANLVFHVNTSAMGTSPIAQRIYLYDFTNNQPIIDYLDDKSVSSNLKNSKFVYGGILIKETAASGGGSYYKFRITNQIRNLLKNVDSTNVKFGLVVTEDIRISAFGYLKGANVFPTQAPFASVMNPLGTIVYGGTKSVPADKKLKLEIYYTKPN